jgi:hypothetical protein
MEEGEVGQALGSSLLNPARPAILAAGSPYIDAGADRRRDMKENADRLSPFVYAFALVHFLLHVLTQGNYGIFRDELYYLACADHLAWGYVDQPPLSIAVLAALTAVAGESLAAIRLLPSLAGAALVVLTALMARELGGRRWAQVLAALAVAVTPEYLGLTGIYSMNAIDLVFWALAALVLIRLVKTDEPRLWLAFGAVAGLGLLNKVSILFLGFGVAVALVLTPLRRHLRTPYPWLGGLLALALFSPHLVWQVRNDWPTLEFMENASRYKIADLSPLEFFVAQVMNMHPLNFPIWLGGLAWLLVGREGRRFRAPAIVFLAVFTVLAVQNSKPYYLAAAFPPLFAGGALAIERLTERRAWARPVAAGVLAFGWALAPFAVPVLTPKGFVAYQRALGVEPRNAENSALGALPQHFADRFGWPELADVVAEVYESLPEDERRDAMIVTSNYGQAGALRYFGRGLPPAVSQHNSFYLWGPGPGSGEVVILIGEDPDDEGLLATFESVTFVRYAETSPWAMPYERRAPISICRGLKVPLEEAWRRGKHYI